MSTIKDIARISGYSIGTVSRVINHHPDVSDKARKRIEEVIQQEGFEPNVNAQFLKQSRTSSIVIIMKGNGSLFLANLFNKVLKELRKHDENADVLYIDVNTDEVRAAAKYAQERKPKGIIFLGGEYENFRKEFSSIHIPSVLLTLGADGLDYHNLSSFSTDDYQGSKMAAELLIRHHHTKIGMIGKYPSITGIEKRHLPRYAGMVDTLTANGISFDPEKQYVYSPFSMKDSYEAMEELLHKFPDMTAVFTHSDIIAIGAARALHDDGIRIPQDISLIGYDGIELTQFMSPRLTTIRRDADDLAERAVHDLLYRIIYPSQKGIIYKSPMQLIESESVGDAGNTKH